MPLPKLTLGQIIISKSGSLVKYLSYPFFVEVNDMMSVEPLDTSVHKGDNRHRRQRRFMRPSFVATDDVHENFFVGYSSLFSISFRFSSKVSRAASGSDRNSCLFLQRI